MVDAASRQNHASVIMGVNLLHSIVVVLSSPSLPHAIAFMLMPRISRRWCTYNCRKVTACRSSPIAYSGGS